MGRQIHSLFLSPFISQKLLSVLASENSKDLSVLRELIEAEQIKPTIDRTFTLNETPSAIRYLLEGRARGKIVVVV